MFWKGIICISKRPKQIFPLDLLLIIDKHAPKHTYMHPLTSVCFYCYNVVDMC